MLAQAGLAQKVRVWTGHSQRLLPRMKERHLEDAFRDPFTSLALGMGRLRTEPNRWIRCHIYGPLGLSISGRLGADRAPQALDPWQTSPRFKHQVKVSLDRAKTETLGASACFAPYWTHYPAKFQISDATLGPANSPLS